MPDIINVDADLPVNRAAVKFRNMDKPCMVIAADKAAGDAKNFREAAGLLRGVSGQRAKDVAAWLNDLAQKFELDA